jgi:hypothetical protein
LISEEWNEAPATALNEQHEQMALEYTVIRGVSLCVAVLLLAGARSEIAMLQPRYRRC